MVAMQIRDVPDDLRDVLVNEATLRGTSLQALLLSVLQEHATSVRNVEILRQFSDRSDGMRAGPDEIAADIRAMREERADQVGVRR